MKKELNILLIFALLAMLFACKEEDTPTPDGSGSGGGGGTVTDCTQFTDDVFPTHNVIDNYSQISFAQGQTGFAIGKNDQNLAVEMYTIMRSNTSTHNQDWEVAFSDIDLGDVKGRLLFPNGSNAYCVKGNFAHRRLMELNLQTGEMTTLRYSGDIEDEAPAIENMNFFTPNSHNDANLVGIAVEYDEPNVIIPKNYYIYMANMLSHDIVEMIKIEVPEPYLSEEGVPNIGTNAEVHIFSDDSFVFGPVGTENESDLNYAFFAYDMPSREWLTPSVIAAHDQDMEMVLNYYPIVDKSIFSNVRGEEFIYMEHSSTDAENIDEMSLYKISNKGRTITALPDLAPELKQHTVFLSFDENAERGVIYGQSPLDYTFASTKDGGLTWTISTCPMTKIILMPDMQVAGGSVFIGSDNTKEGNAGIIKIDFEDL